MFSLPFFLGLSEGVLCLHCAMMAFFQVGSSYENRWLEYGAACLAIIFMALAAVLGTRFINHQKR